MSAFSIEMYASDHMLVWVGCGVYAGILVSVHVTRPKPNNVMWFYLTRKSTNFG